ncbi:MAG: hypothetical protein AB1Z98_03685 [Nannocystaceae bacterium]
MGRLGPARARLRPGGGSGMVRLAMSFVVTTVRRFESRAWELWLVPTLVTAAGAAVLRSANADVVMLRGLVFVGGPLLLLAGLHARLESFLHARARLNLLPLPLAPRVHWAAARPPHRRGLVWTGVLGAAGIGAVGLWSGVGSVATAGLVADWLWLWLMAWLLEPVIPAASAWMGRRFDEDAADHRTQQYLGGGFTIPEAVVHLYAPAMGLGLAALVAMPGQLWIDRFVDSEPTPAALLAVALGAAAAAGLAALGAGRVYARGLFGAVPWVHEAVKTLAGPPVPEPVPGWLLVGRDPVQHLVVRQFWRTTPAPSLRLWGLLGGAAWIGLAASPSVPAAAIVLALGAVWLVPGATLRSLAPARARLCGPLPLSSAGRAGRSLRAWAVLAAPVAVALLTVALAWSRA